MTIGTSASATAEAPELPVGTISLQAPPDQVEAQGMGNILAMVIPMMGSMGVMVFMAFSSAGDNPRTLLMGGGMIVAMLGMVGFNIFRQLSGHRRKVDSSRREYLAYLGEMRETVRTAARRQRRYTNWYLPDPRSMVLVAAEGSRLWERDQGAPDALNFRLGCSTQDLSMELLQPEVPPLANHDVVCASALSRFLATHGSVDDMPLGVSLGEFSHLEVAGDPTLTRAAARAMLIHLATFVPPTALKIAVLCSEAARGEWDWLKWLPHARSSEESDALGPARMVTTDYADLADLLGEDVTKRVAFEPRSDLTQWPQVLIVTDGLTLPPTTRLGSREGTVAVTVLSLPTAWGALTSLTTLRLVLHPSSDGVGRPAMEVVMLDREPLLAVPDQVSVAQAEAVARRMTQWVETERPEAELPAGRSDAKRTADLTDLLDVGDIRDFDPDRQWVRRDGRDRLRVPFGVTPEGVPVSLDIKESAQFGMGPHGLLIGATGSGKSEVLRTLVLALALTHSPEQLNLVLVDFKGGATFAGMADLPHVSAMISNLESELSLVDRMQDALRGEMVRRQELLREAGNYANVTDYEADRIAGKHSHPPLPALFIILDEFSELLSAKPDFIDTFVAVGRLGRSMSIHLLLASQRLEEGRLRGLDSHLSYRIGLRTFSPQESRAVLGATDAYELPSVPGVGYLKAGTEALVRFRASYVAAPPPPRRADAAHVGRAGAPSAPIRILPFTAQPQLDVEPALVPAAAAPAGPRLVHSDDHQWGDRSQIDIAVAKLAGHGMPAHQVWLPPLDVPDTLDALMPDLDADPALGLVSASWRASGPLRVPLGVVDLPLEQRRETLVFDLAGAGGHLAVVGGPLSGKSTALRTLVMALSLTHTPAEVQFYILDFGGGTFAPFEGAVHVSVVASRDRAEAVNRTVAEIESIVVDRERYFRANRIDSMATYRTGRAEGRFDDGYGDVFLVVDGWATIRSDFEDLEQRLIVLVGRALTFGVHLVLSAARWMDVRQQIRDVIGSRLELRLGEPSDSELDRKLAALVPIKRPGRGIDAGRHHVLVGLPRIDGDQDLTTLAAGVTATLDRIADAAPAPGPKLRLLPTKIQLAQVQELAPASQRLLLGLEEARMGPLEFDPGAESHLFLLGDARSGKTNFLRTVATEVMRTHTAEQAQFVAVDLRRALLGELPEPYTVAYATTREQAQTELTELAGYLRTRLPGADVTPDQLRNRSWWRGAEVWVLVDDYDLVVTSAGNPLAVLQPLLAQAQDVGLHLVVARRAGGAGRAMYETVLQTLTELGATGILLSGNPEEGALIGRVKPMRMPPGRAQVVSRDRGRQVAQLVWTPPTV